MFVPFQICLLLLAQPTVEDATVGLVVIQEILADFAARQQRWSSFEYHYHGTFSIPKGYYANDRSDYPKYFPSGVRGPLPPERLDQPMNGSLAIDFKSRCARKEVKNRIFQENLARLVPEQFRHTYDGSRCQFFTPREWNSELGYELPVSQPDLYLEGSVPHRGFFGLEDFPIQFAHGILEERPPHLQELPSPNQLEYLGERVLGSQLCDVIIKRIKSKDLPEFTWEYWIDRQQRSAVQRLVFKNDGQEICRYDIQHEDSTGEWLPAWWRITRGIGDPETTELREYTVDSRTFGKPLAPRQMHATVQPGIVVRDEVLNRTYYLGTQGIEDIEDDNAQPILLSLPLLPFGGPALPIALALVVAFTAIILWRNRCPNAIR